MPYRVAFKKTRESGLNAGFRTSVNYASKEQFAATYESSNLEMVSLCAASEDQVRKFLKETPVESCVGEAVLRATDSYGEPSLEHVKDELALLTREYGIEVDDTSFRLSLRKLIQMDEGLKKVKTLKDLC